MEVDGTILKQVDAGGVLPLLFMVSGYVAMERGSEFIEPRDLVKAIYIVDLEHVGQDLEQVGRCPNPIRTDVGSS